MTTIIYMTNRFVSNIVHNTMIYRSYISSFEERKTPSVGQTFLEFNNVWCSSEHFGRSTAASQYFLQLAGYLGIPVISWNADNSGFERRVSGDIMRYFQNLNNWYSVFEEPTAGPAGSQHWAPSVRNGGGDGEVGRSPRSRPGVCQPEIQDYNAMYIYVLSK